LSPSAVPALSLHDALPISGIGRHGLRPDRNVGGVDLRQAARQHLAPLFALLRREWPVEREASNVGDDAGGAVDLEEAPQRAGLRSEEHTSELQSRENLVCR